MPTSKDAAHAQGYEQAVKVLFDEAKANTPQDRKRLAAERRRLEQSEDYQGVRALLDKAPDTFHMTRPTAQFYLCMSPTTFKQALAQGPHPFEEPRGGALKGQVDAWFKSFLAAKHADKVPKLRTLKVGRGVYCDMPYLIDASGKILAHGQISMVGQDDADLANKLNKGVQILYLDLNEALARPWRDPEERHVWAQWRQWLLRDQIARAEEALREAQAQDLRAGDDRPLPPGGRRSMR